MEKIAVICSIVAVLSVLDVGLAQNNQNQTVTYCPLYLVLQNRCPTPSTTTTTKRPDGGNNSNGGGNNSGESDVTDGCGLPTLTFCPAIQAFLSGGKNCTEGQTIEVSLTTLGELLVSPTGENAAATVGQDFVDALGEAFSSIAKTIQATPTQATIGVTFVPIGQIVG